jgi:DNA-binding transcriptional LysR family regulator
MITLRQLTALQAVMKYRTATEAAEMMALSQPALSKLISNLEYETGLTLFLRVKRRLVPTEEARLLNDYAGDVFDGLRRIENISDEIRDMKYGRLRVVTVMALARTLIPQVLSEYLADKPDITVSLATKTMNTVTEIVAAQSYDVGFTFGVIDHPGIETIALLKLPVVCVLPNDDPLAKEPVIRARHLGERRLISLASSGSFFERFEPYMRRQGIPFTVSIETHQSETACEFVSHGMGVSLVNPFAATEYENRGLLTAVPFEAPFDLDFSVIIPAGQPPSLVAKEFTDLVIAEIKNFSAKFSG